MTERQLIGITVWFLIFVQWTACVPPEFSEKKTDGTFQIDVNDKRVQRLFDFRDRRQSDSLIRYFKNPDPALRFLSALAFASVKDSSVVEPLAELLKDPSEDVRIAAAFSLGLLGTSRAETYLVKAFRADDSLSQHQKCNSIILEAIGRCGGPAHLKHLAQISTYQTTDTLLLEGQCLGIYRYALRGMTLPEATAKMIEYVANDRIPERVRLVAANYLARAADIQIDSNQAILMAAGLVRALDPEIRMFIARALGKSKNQVSFGILSKTIQTERDWRVRCNMINALSKFQYDTVRSLVVPFIFDTNVHVARTAAEFFIENGQAKDGNYYWRIARDNPNLPWEVAVALYRAGSRWLSGRDEPESKDFIVFRLKELYQNSANNPYLRAACLRGLGETGWQFRWIADRGLRDVHPVVRTAAAEVLSAVAQKTDFFKHFGEGARSVRREIYQHLRNGIASGDVGVIATAAIGLQSEVLKFNQLEDTSRLNDLKTALSKLKLPRDIEAYQSLEKALAFFESRPPAATPRPAFNHPIEWDRLATMPPSGRVSIKTSAGNIEIQLLPEWAPGSVANFLVLARQGFFDGKTFHRVVPNFVVQGGCPRGDGYGALDYSIRTEISPLRYDRAGWVGMASAGMDTEGTQFFITHSPTLHLDGNYTIFGKVVSGQNIVDKLQTGSLIEKVVLGSK